MSAHHAVVVGGGPVGTACAYYLAKAGWRVTLVERDRQGFGAASGNCGILCYGHVIPLNAPGAILYAIKSIGRSDSALCIRPRLDPALWHWFFRFALSSNERSMLASAKATVPLLESSMVLNRQLMDEESFDCEREERGCLFVFASSREMDLYEKTDLMLQERFNIAARRYDEGALLELEPALKPGTVAGAWLYEREGHLRPEAFLRAWRHALERLGVAIREHCEVQRIARTNGKATALVAAGEEIPAEVFVFATGAWTPKLNRELGCRIPIQPGKGYSITMPRPTRCPKHPMIFKEDKVVVTPMQSAYRLGSTMEFAGYDDTLRQDRLDLLVRCASKYLHEPTAEPIQEKWFGWRPMTYDGLPIIDRTPAMENVYIAAGHNMLGMTLASTTGKLIAEMVEDKETHIDVNPYAVTRF